jgi:hypothetical protein
MTLFSRLLPFFILACLVLAVAAFLRGCFAAPDPSAPPPPASAGSLQRERQRGADLDAKMEASRAQLFGRSRIARDLVDGRLTLAEAVRRLRALQAGNAVFWEGLRAYEMGDSDTERLGRHLIGRAQGILSDEPRRARTVLARLEAELEGLKAGEAPAASRPPVQAP